MRDHVGVDDFRNRRAELDEVLASGVDRETTDENRPTVRVVLAEELFVRVRARDEGLVLHIEGVDAITVILADGLREQVRMPTTRSDVVRG